MGVNWNSDKKSWDYKWEINSPITTLARYNDTLGFNFHNIGGPTSLLALINLIHSPMSYVPVLQYDEKLKRKGVDVIYSTGSVEKGYSYVYCKLSVNVAELAKNARVNSKIFYKNRKAEEVPEFVDVLKNLEEKNKPRNLDEELMEDLVNHRKFCELLVKNRSGLRVS